MAAALIALGSNVGDRQRILDDAIAQLAAQPGIHLAAKSRWHATRPVGGPPGQGEFLNGAVLVETTLSPEQLHAALKQIETAAGRNRAERWAPRTLDLDLLLFDKQVIDSPELTVPHPRMAFRRFVLEPAAEIAPNMRHPTVGRTVEQLYRHMGIRTPYIAAITGAIAADKAALATAASAALAGRVILDPEPIDLSLDAIRARRFSFEGLIELLERRARPIRLTGWTSSDFMTISDYAYDESEFLCIAAVDRMGEFLDRFRELNSTLSRPKLLVSLKSPPRTSRFIETIIASIPNQSRTRDTMVELSVGLGSSVAIGWDVPLLRLDACKPEAALQELVAAIQSMQ